MDISEEELDRMVDEFMNEQLEKLATEHIAPYTCQLFVKVNGEMKPQASGVFIILNDSIYLLTALHVVEQFTETNPLYFMIGEEAFELDGTVMGLKGEGRIDLGYIRLKEGQVLTIALKYSFLPIERILYPTSYFEEEGFCVFGYPTQLDKAMSYFSQEHSIKAYDYYGLNQNEHYVIELLGKATNIKTHEREKVRIQHYGLSGCGLWQTVLVQKGNKIKATAYLVGIMTEYRSGKYLCLIGNRIHIFLQVMLESGELDVRYNSRFRNRLGKLFGRWPSFFREP
jgi:hypothetical protein